ncbi:MAG: methionine synthase, partial [Gammaproteobacteria bacterium]|nr:methionine synthase [Gammaproteobacteria bacterium]
RRRERHAGKSRLAPQVSLTSARDNRHALDWNAYTPPSPKFTGNRVFDDIDLAELKDYIDWMPFFNAWEFHGKYPAILSDRVVGDAARKLFTDASIMLDKIVSEKWLQARGVIGIHPANTVDHDDIRVFTDKSRSEEYMRLCHLRQQRSKAEGQFHHCLADYLAPAETGIADYIGGFAVTAGIGIDEHVERFEADHDDYSAILLKALADRFAEAFAEYMHQKVRQEFWAYDQDESLSNDDLIAEKYRGIRPAPGYPACPDHTEKAKLWQLLDVERAIDLRLTDSFAMFPTAAVSGFYFSHPESKYFSVGRVSRDQLESYAERKGMTVAEAERWLAPNLGYDPAEADAA